MRHLNRLSETELKRELLRYAKAWEQGKPPPIAIQQMIVEQGMEPHSRYRKSIGREFRFAHQGRTPLRPGFDVSKSGAVRVSRGGLSTLKTGAATFERVVNELYSIPASGWKSWFLRNQTRLRLPDDYQTFLLAIKAYPKKHALPGLDRELRKVENFAEMQNLIGKNYSARTERFAPSEIALARYVPQSALRSPREFRLYLKKALKMGGEPAKRVVELLRDPVKLLKLTEGSVFMDPKLPRGTAYFKVTRDLMRDLRREKQIPFEEEREPRNIYSPEYPHRGSMDGPAWNRYQSLMKKASGDARLRWALVRGTNTERGQKIIREKLGEIDARTLGAASRALRSRSVNSTLIPWGRKGASYRGVTLGELPDHYIAYLYENYVGVLNGERIDPRIQKQIQKDPEFTSLFMSKLDEFFAQTWVRQILDEFHAIKWDGRSPADLRREDPFHPETWGRGLSRRDVSYRDTGYAVSDAQLPGGRYSAQERDRSRNPGLTGPFPETDWTLYASGGPGSGKFSASAEWVRDEDGNMVRRITLRTPGPLMTHAQATEQARRMKERRRMPLDWEQGFGSSKPEDWEGYYASRERFELQQVILRRGRGLKQSKKTGEKLSPGAMGRWEAWKKFLGESESVPYTVLDPEKGFITRWRKQRRYGRVLNKLWEQLLKEETMPSETLGLLGAYATQEKNLERNLRRLQKPPSVDVLAYRSGKNLGEEGEFESTPEYASYGRGREDLSRTYGTRKSGEIPIAFPKGDPRFAEHEDLDPEARMELGTIKTIREGGLPPEDVETILEQRDIGSFRLSGKGKVRGRALMLKQIDAALEEAPFAQMILEASSPEHLDLIHEQIQDTISEISEHALMRSTKSEQYQALMSLMEDRRKLFPAAAGGGSIE